MTSSAYPHDMPAVFPDWSPYLDLDSAARAYLRDPELAMEALAGVLPIASIVSFTLERFVNEVNGVWQEVAVCDGRCLVLWHGEDVPPGEGPPGSMTSSVRMIPLSTVAEVGIRRRLARPADGPVRTEAVDVYVLLTVLDDAPSGNSDEQTGPPRHDALRFVKTLDDGGPGQVARLEEFAQTVAALIGRGSASATGPASR